MTMLQRNTDWGKVLAEFLRFLLYIFMLGVSEFHSFQALQLSNEHVFREIDALESDVEKLETEVELVPDVTGNE